MLFDEIHFISQDEVLDLLKKGYAGIDGHIHSSHSFDVPESSKTNPLYLIKKQLDMYLIPIITDHDDDSAYEDEDVKKYLREEGLEHAVRSAEITIKATKARRVTQEEISEKKPLHTMHINVYNMTHQQFLDLEHIASHHHDLDMFVDYLRRNKIPYLGNHLFYRGVKEKLRWKAIPELAKYYFDVLELNAGQPKIYNDPIHG